MSNANAILRKRSRQTVVLPAATQAAREDGDLGPDDNVTITIRKVRTSEVMAHTGQPQRLYALARDRLEGETREEQTARLNATIKEDAGILKDALQQAELTRKAIVLLGVVEPQITEDGAGDTLTPDDLGDDFDHVHDAIVSFAGLPYSRLGGAADPDGFLEDTVAGDSEPHGEGVQHDPGSASG